MIHYLSTGFMFLMVLFTIANHQEERSTHSLLIVGLSMLALSLVYVFTLPMSDDEEV